MTEGADIGTLLASLPLWAFAGVLLLCRIGCACTLLPGVGEMELPMMVRAGFVLVFAALMLPVLGPTMPPVPDDIAGLVAMIAAEIVTGFWIGWLARMMLLAMPMAGQIIAAAIGMTSVLQPDAMLGAGASALSRMMGLAAPVLVLASGLYVAPIEALAGSYRLVAPGTVLPVGDTVSAYVSAMGEAFTVALRLAAPFLMAAVLYHVALGLISRLVPQLQTYFAAMPGQIIGGLLLLGVLASAMAATWSAAARDAFSSLPGL